MDVGDPPGNGGWAGADRDAGQRQDVRIEVVLEVGMPDIGAEADVALPADIGAGCAEPTPTRPEADRSAGEGGELGTLDVELEVEGVRGYYVLLVPPCYDSTRPFGLAVVLHDTDGNREYLRHKWADTARDREYLVALPLARPTYDNTYRWVENRPTNSALVHAVVVDVEAKYQVDRNDTVLAGLGVGATFAMELAVAQAEVVFEGLFAVNPAVFDAGAEVLSRVFVVEGRRESSALARREPTDRFRYEFAPALGPFYPGPPYARRPDDPGVTGVSNEVMLDWLRSVSSL